MKLKMYVCQEGDSGQGFDLTSCSVEAVPDDIWQNLAANVAKELSLTAYPAEVLADRWQQGRAALALKDGQPISYISLVPVYTDTLRIQLGQALDVNPQTLPQIDIDESATGWTHPTWRQRGLSLQLRRKLLGRFAGQERLTVTIAVGLGAAPVVSRLGWRLLSWNDAPFVSSLVGLPVIGLKDGVEVGRRLPPEMKLYRGQHISVIKESDHPWQQFCHFWVSDYSLALRLDQSLASLNNNDLYRWRVGYSHTLETAPNPKWKPFLFDEDYGR